MKHNSLFLWLCILQVVLFYFHCSAQEIEWQNTIGGSDLEILNSVQQTTDGGYILGGWSQSNISGDKTENSWGTNSRDYWMVKTDSLGNILWQNTIGGNLWDELNSIQQTADGGYILGGSSQSVISGDKTESSWNNSFDYWIVKTDSLGNILWQNDIGGNDDDYLIAIQQTTDGGYILGGYSYSNISAQKTENRIGENDYWIVKTDSLGNILWQNTIGGNLDDILYSIQQTADGGYIIGGYSSSNISGDKTEDRMGSTDYWIIKTDSLGNILWQNTIGGNDDDILYSIRQTVDKGFILGGYSFSNISGDKTENQIGATGFADYWILKTDSLGSILWQNTIGGNGDDALNSATQTADGGYILCGYSNSNISGDKTESSLSIGDFDNWIIKTDSTGNILWQNAIGGNSFDFFNSVHQTIDGGYIFGGYSGSNISGDKTENSMGGYDYWIVKLNNKYNNITGNVYADGNNNSVHDGGELALKNKMITELNTGRIGFSNASGDYNVVVLDTGNYTVQAASQNYYSSMPQTNNANFTAFQQADSLNDFAFQPMSLINDLCVTITPTGPFRSGFNAGYNITYSNAGTNTISNCQLVFYLDSTIAYVSSSQIPSLIFADSIVWNIDSLIPLQDGNITVIVHINAGMPIGTFIDCWTRIFPLAGDANPACNSATHEVFTTGSFDPNDIIVNRSTLYTTEILNPPFLEYTIRFQNTGNDTAFAIKILNPLDTTRLQLSTFELIAASHPLTSMRFIYHERNMEFVFDNILLPDSNVNEPSSHGFVRYRIKPKNTLVVNDQVQNMAAIYFDLNPPVITDTAITTVISQVFVESPTSTSSGLRVFPNPVTDKVIIRGAENVIRITDSFGRVVYQSTIRNHSEDITLDVKQLDKGVYIVEAGGGKVRFVKQ